MIIPVLLCAIAAVLYAIYKEFTKKPSTLVLAPKVSGSIPYLGNIGAVVNPKKFFVNARAKYGDLYRFQLFGREWMVLSGRDHFQQYFKSHESVLSFSEPTNRLNINRALFGTAGEQGQSLALFSTAAVKKAVGVRMDEAISRISLRVIQSLPNEGTVDINDLSQKIIGQIISETILGIPIDLELLEELQRFAKQCDKCIMTTIVSTTFAEYLILPKVDRARDEIKKKLLPLVASARKNRGPQTTVFLDYLLTNKIRVGREEERTITDSEIISLFLSTFFAAVSITGQAFANLMLMIANHPEKVPELRDELKNATSFALVNDNKLLQSWIDETARVSKGFCGSMRLSASEKQEIAGYDVPKDTWFFLDSMSSDILTEEIKDIGVFRPERWLEPVKVAKNLNWGAGVHLCPGRNFAYAEMKHSVVQVLKTLHFEKSEEPIVWNPDMVSGFRKLVNSYQVKYHKL